MKFKLLCVSAHAHAIHVCGHTQASSVYVAADEPSSLPSLVCTLWASCTRHIKGLRHVHIQARAMDTSVLACVACGCGTCVRKCRHSFPPVCDVCVVTRLEHTASDIDICVCTHPPPAPSIRCVVGTNVGICDLGCACGGGGGPDL